MNRWPDLFLSFPFSNLPNCLAKLCEQEEDQEELMSLHTVGEGDDSDSLSQWLTEITSLFSFKRFHGPAESLEVVFREHWVHHLPGLLAFWLKPPLLSTNIYEYWFCKQLAAGLNSFHNT